MVYLIHFKEKLGHAQHYVGFAINNLEARIEAHRKGCGARLMEVIKEKGIDWEVARVWEDADRHFERSLKNTNNTKHYCPACCGGEVRDYKPKTK